MTKPFEYVETAFDINLNATAYPFYHFTFKLFLFRVYTEAAVCPYLGFKS